MKKTSVVTAKDDEKSIEQELENEQLTLEQQNLILQLHQDKDKEPYKQEKQIIFMDNNQQRFNPFGGKASVHNTPFDIYQFGGVVTRSYMDISAPITNAPNPPFVDALMSSTSWSTTFAEQLLPYHWEYLISDLLLRVFHSQMRSDISFKPQYERKKNQENEKLASITQQTSNQTIVKTPQPKNNEMEVRKASERIIGPNSSNTSTSKSRNSAITAGSPQHNNATINVISSPADKIRPLSKTSGNVDVNSNEHFTSRSPSEMFTWDFIQMLLKFPLDPPHATIEIMQDLIYANSSTLDGQRFADEFVKRKMRENELSEAQRERIISVYLSDTKQTVISTQLGIPTSTVNNTIKRYKETGSALPEKRPGRLKILNQRDK
ncbi:17576_t:CDS:10 [Funneliformis geosporum]|uniref:17576_t:CDS:1 n=1 Tax=Funneliformis geosporum TaxID=1117311 RepID=A0A9W4SKY8_9GLOM|nr:17576_t:CDS:10 [Funneliformis geosporum]